jgi:hypothetical protein
MKAEVLYIEGCPNHQLAVDNLRLVAEQQHCSVDIVQIEVHTAEEARQLAFLGSPSIRIDGIDIEPGARNASAFGLGCRSYLTPEGRRGSPSIAMIREGLVEALSI